MSHPIIPGPVQPAADPSSARKDLARFGYCVLPDTIPSAQVHALRQRVEEQMEAERRRGLGYAYGEEHASMSNRWVSMLINKGQVFLDLLEHPVADQLLGELLGEGYLLSSYAVHITRPGVPARPLCHTDQWWMPRPYPRNLPHRAAGDVRRGECYGEDQGEPQKLISPPVVASILWLLSDFNDQNGGTRLVPGSHLSGEEPDPNAPYPAESIAVTGSAGTAIVFDGRIWHGAGTNRGNAARFGLFTTYCAGMFRQLENYTLGIAPEVRAKASPRVLARLGFMPWQGYGRVGENLTDLVSFEQDYVGELRD